MKKDYWKSSLRIYTILSKLSPEILIYESLFACTGIRKDCIMSAEARQSHAGGWQAACHNQENVKRHVKAMQGRQGQSEFTSQLHTNALPEYCCSTAAWKNRTAKLLIEKKINKIFTFNHGQTELWNTNPLKLDVNLNFITLLQPFFYHFFSWKVVVQVCHSRGYSLFSQYCADRRGWKREKPRDDCVHLCDLCMRLCIVTEHSISYYIWALQLGSGSRRPSSMSCV